MPVLPPELRKALLQLPQKEKDQLLTRLVAQDAVLTEQLAYRLLEGPDALETRRAALRALVDDPVRGFHQTPNDLLVVLRQVQARLAYHVKITDDAFGEAELSWRLLANVFRHQAAAVARLHGPTQPLLQHLPVAAFWLRSSPVPAKVFPGRDEAYAWAKRCVSATQTREICIAASPEDTQKTR